MLNNAQNTNLRVLQQIDWEQHFANHSNFTIVQSNNLEWQFPAFTKEWLNTTVHKTFETKFLNESLQRLRQKLVQGNKKRALIVVLPLKKWPNTNTKKFQLPKNDRIQIWILFGSPKTTKYENEYYSAFQKWRNTNTNIIGLSKNTNNIFFVLAQQCNIRGAFIHFSFWALKPVKAHYCAQRQNVKEYKRTIYFQKVQTGCIFLI